MEWTERWILSIVGAQKHEDNRKSSRDTKEDMKEYLQGSAIGNGFKDNGLSGTM